MKTWLKANWKTTLAGALSLAATAYAISRDPQAALNPQTITSILAGVGLLAAADSGNKPTPAQ